jgi:hypothetical protein
MHSDALWRGTVVEAALVLPRVSVAVTVTAIWPTVPSGTVR